MDTPGKITRELNEGGSRLASAVERSGTGAHNVIDKVTGAAHPAMDRIASSAHRSVDRATGVATRSAAAFNARREQLRLARTRTMEETRDYVRANPMMSIGIAVAAGYLIGRALRPRKR